MFSTITSKQIPKDLKLILTDPKRLTGTVQEGAWEMFYQIFRNKTSLNIMKHQKILIAGSVCKTRDASSRCPVALHAQPVGFSLQIHLASHYCPSQGLQYQDQIHFSSVSLALHFLMQLD